jgi:CBS domain-containing protein
VSTTQTVRDAMVPEPTMLGAEASAQEAGKCLDNEDVRAVFVVEDDGALVAAIREVAGALEARGIYP